MSKNTELAFFFGSAVIFFQQKKHQMKFTIVHAKNVDFTIYKSNFLYFPMFVAPSSSLHPRIPPELQNISLLP